jgi:Ca-activated chloride channel family protein
MQFNFVNPNYLYLLFLIPVVIFLHFYNLKKAGGKALKFANYDAIARIKGIDLYSKNIIFFIFDILIIVLIVFSISGLSIYRENPGSSFTFIIAIDSSASMSATDIKPNRLDAAKETAVDFVNSLPMDSKVGVVSFSGNTFVEQELTSNKGLLEQSINKIKMTSYGGTDIFEAVSISSSLLKNEENKAIILLSDGQINVGNMDVVIKKAFDEKVIVHTVGIGTIDGGIASFGISKLDSDSLKSLAYNTKGKYFNATSKEEMRNALMEVVPITRKISPYSISFYLIIFAAFLFILRQLLVGMKRLSV